MPAADFLGLPNEVLQQILLRVPATSLTAFRCLSRRLRDLVTQFVWRHHCASDFHYWSSKHRIRDIFLDDVGAVDWEKLYQGRYEADKAISRYLDDILARQVGRTQNFENIVEYGYDAKDTLLRHFQVHDDADDVLARRYYSDAVLALLQRTCAVEEWSSLQRGQEVSLERALAAFDMFVLQQRKGDFDEISSQLDRVAAEIREEHPQLQARTPRRRALNIVAYLRSRSLLGLRDISRYHELQNCFLGVALGGEHHPSMPLISTAIFCCIARRLNLDAQACNFPFHVLAVIKPAPGSNMDGNLLTQDGAIGDPMYLDPFRSDHEIPGDHLTTQLHTMGVPETSYALTMDAAPTTEIVLRTARNILTSVHDTHYNAVAGHGNRSRDQFDETSSSPDTETAFYSALWACVVVGRPRYGDVSMVANAGRNTFLPSFIEHFETHFPTDVSLVERYIVPLFQAFGQYSHLQETIAVMRRTDSMPKQVKRRAEAISQRVRYKVGQVFRHKRYRYHGVITGWDVECGANEQWMVAMRVDELARGRHQSFYHVLVEDKSVRYVAEENVEITTPDIPYNLMGLAGRHFKRWDCINHVFVSNVKDEYPDD